MNRPVPRAKKPKTTEDKTEEKEAATAGAPAAAEGVNIEPAGEKEAAPEESKAEEPAPTSEEQVTKVAEEVPEKAQEAAAIATEAPVETKGAVSSGATEVGSVIPLDLTLKTDEDKEVTIKDLVAEKGYVQVDTISLMLILVFVEFTEPSSSFILKPILLAARLKHALSA